MATRMFLNNLWTTPHRIRDRVRHGCCSGCDAPEALDRYVERFPFRMVAGMFDDEAARKDYVSVRLRGVRTPEGPSGAVCWLARHTMPSGLTVAPTSFPLLSMRTGQRDALQCRPFSAARLLWHEVDGREVAAPGQRQRAVPHRRGRRIGPPAVASERT